jgi:hypothetical protein
MKRGVDPLLVAVTAIVLAIASSFAVQTRLSAQDATPVASPVISPVASPIAGSVPCTALFGIAEGQACLLTLNGTAALGALDLYIDGTLAVAGIPFASLGEYIPVSAGEHEFALVPSGQPPANAAIVRRGTLAEGTAYELSTFGAGSDLRVLILPVDTRPLAEGTSRLRLVHGSPDIPALDLAITGGVPLVRGVPPGQASPAIDVPTGVYELEVRVAGTEDVLLPLPGIALLPNTTYSVYVSGSPAQGSLGATLAPVFIAPDIAASATPVA